jgi:hypothetical protein
VSAARLPAAAAATRARDENRTRRDQSLPGVATGETVKHTRHRPMNAYVSFLILDL